MGSWNCQTPCTILSAHGSSATSMWPAASGMQFPDAARSEVIQEDTCANPRVPSLGSAYTRISSVWGPYLQNFRLLMRCALVLAEAPVHFLFGALTGVTIPLLQAPYQLIPFSCN